MCGGWNRSNRKWVAVAAVTQLVTESEQALQKGQTGSRQQMRSVKSEVKRGKDLPLGDSEEKLLKML